MEDFRIIYPNGSGGIAVVIPAPDISLEQAMQAVPDNSPYWVVAPDAIPSDRSFREAWISDFSNAPVKEPAHDND